MIEVINSITACGNAEFRENDISRVEYIMVHRFGSHDLGWWDDNLITPTAAGVAAFYRDNPEARKATGGRMPYGFVFSSTGRAEQAEHLGDVTPHAKRFNHSALGLGCMGDFRFSPPTVEMWKTLTHTVAALLRYFDAASRAYSRPFVKVIGHTDVPGATGDAKKTCPGKLLDVTKLEHTARAINEANAAAYLMGMGITL